MSDRSLAPGTTWITFPSDYAGSIAQVPAFLARPSGPAGEIKARGGVIVVHEAFGLTGHIREVATRYAHEGFTALAVDFFCRQGDPPPLSGGFGPLREFMGKVPDAQVMADVEAAAAYLQSQPGSNGKVGIVGYCWGGRVVMLAAAKATGLDAGSAYYGRITGETSPNQPEQPLQLVSQMSVPLQGHFGEEDQGIPVANIEKLREQLTADGKTAEIYIYPNAGHAFNNDDRPEMYRQHAAQLALQRTLDWFGKYLGA